MSADDYDETYGEGPQEPRREVEPKPVVRHHVEMFTASDFRTPGSTWGYQCFTCHETHEGFKTLVGAEVAANQHQNDTEGLS